MAAVLACALASTALPQTAAATPGVSSNWIRIGFHGPVSGAVPLPNDSADRAARVFWRWLRAKNRQINGRNVSVALRNDQTNPTQAVAVCKEMVEQERVFALASLPAGLPYQIQACARYADSVGVPYVSLGVGREFLEDFDGYFAVSETYPAQARLLADLFADRLRARREVNGIAYADSASSRAPLRAFKRAMDRRRVNLDYERSVSHMAGTTEARLVVEELRLAGVENVFFLHNPMFFLNVLKQADTQAYSPQWTGIDTGIPNRDVVVETSCDGGGSVDGARFLTAIPAYVDRDSFDPRHDRAMRRVYGARGDATTWMGWSLSKAIRRMLEKPGRKLTRARFERTVERARIRTGILPKVRFRPDDHFGGRGIHLLRAECSDERWHTVRRFVNDF